MEFLRIHKHRSAISEAVYILLNVGLAIALMLIVQTTGLMWPSLILLTLSFWRIFAVRMQFWFANIQANLVSFIVGVSYVVFLYVFKTNGVSEANSWLGLSILAILYACWLLFIKPRSKRKYIVIQAAVAVFVGVTAIYMITFDWFAAPVMILMWLVGYASSRHILSSYGNEDRVVLVSLSWALIMAELGWLAYHWTIAYKMPFVSSLLIPQISIVALSISFLAYKIYDSIYHNERVIINDIILPLMFVIAIVAVLLIGFNDVTNISV
jgi:hypothetical protein